MKKKGGWKVEKFSYHKVYSRVESGKIFVAQSIQWDRGQSIRKKRAWKMDKFLYHKVYSRVEDEVYGKKGILHPSTIFQNTRILKIIKIFVSYHSGRGRSIRKKKGLESGKIFVSQNIS